MMEKYKSNKSNEQTLNVKTEVTLTRLSLTKECGLVI